MDNKITAMKLLKKEWAKKANERVFWRNNKRSCCVNMWCQHLRPMDQPDCVPIAYLRCSQAEKFHQERKRAQTAAVALWHQYPHRSGTATPALEGAFSAKLVLWKGTRVQKLSKSYSRHHPIDVMWDTKRSRQLPFKQPSASGLPCYGWKVDASHCCPFEL